MNNLENLLKERGITKKDLAESLNLPPQTISSWKKRGTIPTADVAIEVAKSLNVSVEYLVKGIDSTATNRPSQEVLELAEDIFRLPVEYQEIIRQNVESYKALCFKLEKASSQGIG